MIECVRRTSRNVKHWSSGEMALRWTAAGMLEAERQFRRIIGYRDLAKLAVAIERPEQPARIAVGCDHDVRGVELRDGLIWRVRNFKQEAEARGADEKKRKGAGA